MQTRRCSSKREKLSLIFQQIEYVATIFHDLKMGEHSFSTRPAADLCQHMLVAFCSLSIPMVPISFNQRNRLLVAVCSL